MDNVLQRSLFQYRGTPHSLTGISPTEVLQSRKLRTALDLVHPDIRGNVSTAQANQVSIFNQKVMFRELNPDQPVWVRTFSTNEEKWPLGTARRALGPVTYEVDIDGKLYSRHINHLRPAANKQAENIAPQHFSVF